MRQNRLFSTLYITGTGLAIAMTVIMAVIYYVKLAPVYPEENRSNTLYLTNAMFHSEKEKSNLNAGLSYRALQEWIYPLKNVVAVSAHLGSGMAGTGYIQPADRSGDFRPALKLVDPAFFRIYPLRFVDGNPFTDSDLESGICTAVISDDLARRLFGSTEEVVGRSFTLDYIDYRVCGVVRGASYLTNESYAQVYLPYSVIPNYKKPLTERFPYCGQYNITFLVEDDAQADALRAEIKELTRRVNLEYKDSWSIDLWEQPTSHFVSVFQEITTHFTFCKCFSGNSIRCQIQFLEIGRISYSRGIGTVVGTCPEPERTHCQPYGKPSAGDGCPQVIRSQQRSTSVTGYVGKSFPYRSRRHYRTDSGMDNHLSGT